MSEDEGPITHPSVNFVISELLAMTSVISGYIVYLQTYPPSPEGQRRIATLMAMRDQFYAQFASDRLQVQVPLHAEEVAELLETMVGFVEQIKRIFPKNGERDQAVGIINDWRLRLIGIIAE